MSQRSKSHLCRLGLLLLHLSSDETIEHRLEEIDHQFDLSFLLVTRQVDHFVLVASHQTFVADGGFLVGCTAQMRKRLEGQPLDGVCYVPADGLTGREYMALIVSLNCIVDVTKMASVADSDFPLVRKSLTCKRRNKNE